MSAEHPHEFSYKPPSNLIVQGLLMFSLYFEQINLSVFELLGQVNKVGEYQTKFLKSEPLTTVPHYLSCSKIP